MQTYCLLLLAKVSSRPQSRLQTTSSELFPGNLYQQPRLHNWVQYALTGDQQGCKSPRVEGWGTGPLLTWSLADQQRQDGQHVSEPASLSVLAGSYRQTDTDRTRSNGNKRGALWHTKDALEIVPYQQRYYSPQKRALVTLFLCG